MKVQFPTISNPGSFVYDSENPTKYTEACSHAIHKILFALSDAGFQMDDGEDTFNLLKLALITIPDPDDEEKNFSTLKLLADRPIKIYVESVGMIDELSTSPC